jgi:thioredoxin 1
VAEIDEVQFESEVLGSDRPVIVMFWASWSAPCKILTPVMDKVATICVGNVKVFKINADDNPSLSLWYGIQSIPTVLCLANGEVRARIVGTASKEAVLSKVEPLLPGRLNGSPSHNPNKDQNNHGKP